MDADQPGREERERRGTDGGAAKCNGQCQSARDLEGLATALVQIVACTGSVATAMMHQSRYQLPSSPVAVPISAKAPAVSKTPRAPISLNCAEVAITWRRRSTDHVAP